jgi:hypothetical protein
MRRKSCQDDNDWLYAEVGQKMIEWLELKATIRLAADLCDIAEPELADWYRLARKYPNTPMARLVSRMRTIEAEHCGGNGHEPYASICQAVTRCRITWCAGTTENGFWSLLLSLFALRLRKSLRLNAARI